MDEQRMLAEIERRLAAEDPGLATKLSSFKGPGSGGRLRSPRAKIIGALFAVAAALVISLTVYALVPFRAHDILGTTNPQVTGGVPASAPAKAGTSAGGTSASSAAAVRQSSTAKSSTASSQARATSGKPAP
ncbi:MAG TPA: DUF3040 domain-containing protein [Trebonia sp.]